MIALSVDSFAAGLAYGAGGIRMPAVSLLTASAVSSLVLAFSFLLGGMAGGSLPEGAVKAFGFLTLSAIGVWKLFDGSGGKSRFPPTAWQPESGPAHLPCPLSRL